MQVCAHHLLSSDPLSLESVSFGTQSVVLGPAASISPGLLLEMLNLRLHRTHGSDSAEAQVIVGRFTFEKHWSPYHMILAKSLYLLALIYSFIRQKASI